MKNVLLFVMYVASMSVFAQNSNDSDLISSGKTYNLIFDIEKNPSFYNNSNGSGLSYVKNMIKTCDQYKAKCNIKVVIHYAAFPLVVKSGAINPKLLDKNIFYDYSNDIKYIISKGAMVITSKSGMDTYQITKNQLLPNVEVADVATLYIANQVKNGYFLINN